MNSTDISNLRDWLTGYSGGFLSDDADVNRQVRLKLDHSLHVAANMMDLSDRLRLDSDRKLMAEAIGLLHDVGRFAQYAAFRTFRDSISINHGSLGAEIIADKQPLSGVSRDELQMIIDAVRFHNAFAVPGGIDPETMLFCRMIRDADKLDIWRIFSEYWEQPAGDRDLAAGLALPDLPEFSSQAIESLGAGRLVGLSELKVLNDFKIMQLAWIYDLNFPASFQMAVEQGHLERIAATLPEEAANSDAVAVMRRHLRAAASREIPSDGQANTGASGDRR